MSKIGQTRTSILLTIPNYSSLRSPHVKTITLLKIRAQRAMQESADETVTDDAETVTHERPKRFKTNVHSDAGVTAPTLTGHYRQHLLQVAQPIGMNAAAEENG